MQACTTHELLKFVVCCASTNGESISPEKTFFCNALRAKPKEEEVSERHNRVADIHSMTMNEKMFSLFDSNAASTAQCKNAFSSFCFIRIEQKFKSIDFRKSRGGLCVYVLRPRDQFSTLSIDFYHKKCE